MIVDKSLAFPPFEALGHIAHNLGNALGPMQQAARHLPESHDRQVLLDGIERCYRAAHIARASVFAHEAAAELAAAVELEELRSKSGGHRL